MHESTGTDVEEAGEWVTDLTASRPFRSSSSGSDRSIFFDTKPSAISTNHIHSYSSYLE